MTVKRFLRTPKGTLVVILVVLATVAAFGEKVNVFPGLVSSAAVAMIIDGAILRWRKGRWVLPDGAFLTALIVAMVLSAHERWYVAPVTAGIAVLSKYVFRARRANVFNPAVLGLVVTFFMFGTEQDWWGALPDLPLAWLALLVGMGVFIAHRTNKLPVVVTFLGVYYLLFTAMAFLGDPAKVAGMYRAPDLHAALYFAFFMVTDPPTSPPRHRHQVVYGVIVAVVCCAVFEATGAVYYLLAGVLVANVWEAAHRHYLSRPTARAKA